MKVNEQDIYSALGALTPVILQLLHINPHTFIIAESSGFYAGFALRMIALIYSGIICNRVFNKDADVKTAFFNGIAAPSILLAVVEPIATL